jgi:dolichol-phosphate mannosyltransferase
MEWNMELIIIPTYNERDNIGRLLSLIFKTVPKIHVLILDDNSPDGTGEFIIQLMSNQYRGKLFLLQRIGKLGLGTAYIAGFKWALERSYDFIVEMDADFSHNPKYLPAIISAAQTHDLVLGSRYVSGGGVVNWSFLRRIISRGGSLYSRIILGMPICDLTGGFKCFRRKVLETINLDQVKSTGYSFQIELTYRTFLYGFHIVEVPIIFEERAAGKSKMSRKIFFEAVFMVIKLRLELNKLRVHHTLKTK